MERAGYDITWNADGTCCLWQGDELVERPQLQATLERIQREGVEKLIAEGRLQVLPQGQTDRGQDAEQK